MGTHCDICSFKCWGREGYDGSCCHIEDRDFIIGPHDDSEKFLERLSNKFDRKIEFQEVFYSFEEGSELFPEKNSWQNISSYPALKVDLGKERKPCIFYNSTLRSCSVYEIRPNTCRNYHCDFLYKELLTR
jgi:Fe-S-cluster containining protein